MAAPTEVQVGKATVVGVPGTASISAWAAVTNESLRANHDWKEETITDVHGFDQTWIARNEHFTIDVQVRLTAATLTNAKAAGVFQAPYTKVTLSAFDLATLNGDYQYVGGTGIDLVAEKGATMTWKLRQYKNADQQTASTTAVT